MKKYKQLKRILKNMEKVLLAFSGGVDSTLLLKVACRVLGKENVIAVTARSSIRYEKEFERVNKLIKSSGARHIVINTGELNNKQFINNDRFRCYYCKYELFNKMKELADENQISNIIEGTNYDDIFDYRPGMKVLEELNIKSPLRQAKLTKKEIRMLSKKLKLPTWDQPAESCLATRINYGIEINEERLNKVKKVETFLRGFNPGQMRARLHDPDTIRIEILTGKMQGILNNREIIVKTIKKLGFNYITLDLEGFRSGSMDEVLKGEGNNG